MEDAAKRMLLPGGVGLNEFARHYPERFYDVGMAESHAVSFASGLAASGKKVLCAIYAAGAEAVRAVKIARKLKDEHALQVKVVNVRFLKPFDCPSLKADLLKMPVFTLEDHAAATGLGSIAAGVAAEVAGQHRCCLHSFGLPNDRFIACGSVEKLREDAGLDEDSIVREIVRRIRLFQQ